jgi:hypothetical protein
MQRTRVRNHRPSALIPLVIALCALPLTAPRAQTTPAPSAQPAAPPRDMPSPDELEPGVKTTPEPLPPPTMPALPPPGGSDTAADATGVASKANPPRSGDGTAPASGSAAAAKQPAGAKEAAHKAGADRLELGATDITGNRELPKVLYIVPWKRSDLGDLTGKPVNSLLDEVLEPIDRDVFRRENRYYNGLKPDAGGAKAGAAQESANKP